MNRLIICDLDGTLSDCQHRQHLAAGKDWDAFHALMHLDPPHYHVSGVLHTLLEDGAALVFLTGRPEEFREITQQWLYEKCMFEEGTDYLELIMRPRGDYTRDVELKKKLLEESIREGTIIGYMEETQSEDIISDKEKYDAWLKQNLLFLEDRDPVVAMWRDLGYVCWQTAMGAF